MIVQEWVNVSSPSPSLLPNLLFCSTPFIRHCDACGWMQHLFSHGIHNIEDSKLLNNTSSLKIHTSLQYPSSTNYLFTSTLPLEHLLSHRNSKLSEHFTTYILWCLSFGRRLGPKKKKFYNPLSQHQLHGTSTLWTSAYIVIIIASITEIQKWVSLISPVWGDIFDMNFPFI